MDIWKNSIQDFGLEVPEPPSLINLYRYYYGAINNTEDKKALYSALEESIEIITNLRKNLSEQEHRAEHANQKMLESEEKLKRIEKGKLGIKSAEIERGEDKKTDNKAKIEISNSENEVEKVNQGQLQAQIAEEENAKKSIPKRSRDYAFLFTREQSELDENSQRITSLISKIKDLSNENSSIAMLLGETLPDLVPGVILKKRETLLPLILSAVYWHPDDKKRADMTYMLFNLIRVPNSQQRRMILDGCINLAALIGQERSARELLPLAVEAITSQYEDRRIFCAEFCGWIAPKIDHEMRISLMLSILQQLSQDRMFAVRTSSVVNLARVLVLEDKDQDQAHNILTLDPKKYQQLCEIVLSLLQDPEDSVLQITRTTFLPIFGDFLMRMQLFETKYLPSIMSAMTELIKNTGAQTESKLSHQFEIYAEVLVYLTPFIFENVLIQSDFYQDVTVSFRGPKLVSGVKYVKFASAFSQDEKVVLVEKFSDQLQALPDNYFIEFSSKQISKYNLLDWIILNFIPSLLDMIFTTEQTNDIIFNALCNATSTFTQEFGDVFTTKVFKTIFDNKLSQLNSSIANQKITVSDDNKTSLQNSIVKQINNLSIIYIVGIITGLDEKDMLSYLKKMIVDCSIQQNEWALLQLSSLSKGLNYLIQQFEDHKETIFMAASELIFNKDTQVKKTLVYILNSILTLLTLNDISNHLLDLLLNLAQDSDINVRCDVISILGQLAVSVQDSKTVEKITFQLESLCKVVPLFKTNLHLIKTYSKIIPNVTPGFRDTFILKQLLILAKYASEIEDLKQQNELALSLYDAFKSLNGLSIGKDSIKINVLPGLKFLQKIAESLPNEKRNTINNMTNIMQQLTTEKTSVTETHTSSIGGFFKDW